MPQPSIGRIVHYVQPTPSHRDEETVCLPAIIVALAHPDRADGSEQDCVLHVFDRGGSAGRTAPHDEVEMPVGSWHWPTIV